MIGLPVPAVAQTDLAQTPESIAPEGKIDLPTSTDRSVRRGWAVAMLRRFDRADQIISDRVSSRYRHDQNEKLLTAFVDERPGFKQSVERFLDQVVLAETEAISRLSRAYRLAVYQTFRRDRKTYRERLQAWAIARLAWQESGAKADELDLLLEWLLTAGENSRPATLAPLPAIPRFGSPRPVEKFSSPVKKIPSSVEKLSSPIKKNPSVKEPSLAPSETTEKAVPPAAPPVRPAPPAPLPTTLPTELPTPLPPSSPLQPESAPTDSMPETTLPKATPKKEKQPPSEEPPGKATLEGVRTPKPAPRETPKLARKKAAPSEKKRPESSRTASPSAREKKAPQEKKPLAPAPVKDPVPRHEVKKEVAKPAPPSSKKPATKTTTRFTTKSKKTKPEDEPAPQVVINLQELATQIEGYHLGLKHLSDAIRQASPDDATALDRIVKRYARLKQQKDDFQLFLNLLDPSECQAIGQPKSLDSVTAEIAEVLLEARAKCIESDTKENSPKQQGKMDQLDRLSRTFRKLRGIDPKENEKKAAPK